MRKTESPGKGLSACELLDDDAFALLDVILVVEADLVHDVVLRGLHGTDHVEVEVPVGIFRQLDVHDGMQQLDQGKVGLRDTDGVLVGHNAPLFVGSL